MPKSLQELVDLEDDAISLVREWAAASPSHAAIAILDGSREAGGRALEALQITTRSPLGAVAFHTGGILVDHGWLRILGSGGARLPRAIDAWNGLGGQHRCARGLVVADDILGGVFVWASGTKSIEYLAPDTLQWEDLQLGYSDWLEWCFSEDLASFYESLRWEGWGDEIASVRGDQGVHVAPPLIAAGDDIAQRSRRVVPFEELWNITMELEAQLRDLPHGASFRIVVED